MTMPFIQLLLALHDEVEAAVAEMVVDGKSVTVRHHRFREARAEEYPCVSLRVATRADVSGLGEQTTGGGHPEEVRELLVDLVIEMDLEPEEDDPASIAADPTGFAGPSQILERILDQLLPDLIANGNVPNTLGGLVWRIQYDGDAVGDDESTPDAGRLEERLTLLYRVRADHPTELLPEA
jgi:hypothetical protein